VKLNYLTIRGPVEEDVLQMTNAEAFLEMPIASVLCCLNANCNREWRSLDIKRKLLQNIL